jgi:3-mercaptopyruvate sulfurtransferase SseA
MYRLPNKSAQPYEAWEQTAKELIEVEMANRGIRYKELARMLEELGIEESPEQINRKVNRKRFSAAFLVACLRAMGVETISLK